MDRTSIDGAVAVISATGVLVAYLGLVGTAVRVSTARWTTLPRGFGVTVALGVAPAAALVALGHRAGLEIEPLAVLLGAVAMVVLVTGAVVAVRRRAAGRPTDLRQLLPVGGDVIAAVAALALLAPLLGEGLTYWTTYANDFPNYAASAQVWSMGDGHGTEFLQRHPDAFGSFQVHRAEFEKPMVTALLVVATSVTGIPAYSLLAPVMLLSLFVLVSSLLVVASRAFGDRLITVAAAVLVPTVSIVPMSRIYDAQIGQAVAVMLIAALIAIVVGSERRGPHGALAVRAAVVAVVAAACLGSNATLVLATAPSWIALGAWLLTTASPEFRRHALAAACWGAAGAVLLSAPLVSMYVRSLRGQTTGEQGFDIPLALPASVVGLQTSLSSVPPQTQTVLLWFGAGIASAVGYAAYRRGRQGRPVVAVVAAVVVANGLYVAVAMGVDGYAFHKWLATIVAVVVPVVLARAAVLLAGRTRSITTAALVAVAGVGSAIAVHTAATVPWIVPLDLIALAHDERVSSAGAVNVDLGNVYENSIAPLVVGSERVIVTGPTYAQGSLPEGSTFLVRRDSPESAAPGEAVVLDDTYALLDMDLEVGSPPVAFDAAHAENQRFLFGSWLAPEATGTWTSSARAWIVVDLDEELRGRDLDLVIEGARFADPLEPREVSISVNGDRLGTAEFVDSFTPQQIRLRVPADLASADDGRLTIALESPEPISPSMFGVPDDRTLAFWLSAVTVRASGS